MKNEMIDDKNGKSQKHRLKKPGTKVLVSSVGKSHSRTRCFCTGFPDCIVERSRAVCFVGDQIERSVSRAAGGVEAEWSYTAKAADPQSLLREPFRPRSAMLKHEKSEMPTGSVRTKVLHQGGLDRLVIELTEVL